MIKLRKLNASSNKGYLYQFSGTWDTMESIIKNGLWLSGYNETSWETKDSIERDEQGKTKFASFTRNPSALIQSGSGKWRFAVVVDSSRLTDKYKLEPHSYFFNPGIHSYVLEEHEDYYMLAKDTPIEVNAVKLTKVEGDQIVRWMKDPRYKTFIRYREVRPKKLSNFSLGGGGGIWDLDDLLADDEEEQADAAVCTYFFDVNYGGPATQDKSVTRQSKNDNPMKLNYLPMSALPSALYRVAAATATESEERLYPNKKDKHKEYTDETKTDYEMVYNDVDLKKSLVGVLIPDTEYFTNRRVAFETEHPELKIWIYRDPILKNAPSTLQKLKKLLRMNPEVMQLYKLPR